MITILADRTEYYGRAYGTMFCPFVVGLSVTFLPLHALAM